MIRAKRWDGEERSFKNVSEVVRWADSEEGLHGWMQDGDFIEHTGTPNVSGELRVINAEGIETDATINWKMDPLPATMPWGKPASRGL